MFAGFGLGVVMVCHPFFYYLPNLNYIYGMALTKRKFQVESYAGTTRWGYIYAPDDSTKKYPVIFFAHGLGETGSTEASASKLLNNGPLYWINKGWKPDYVIVALQNHTWSISPEHIDYVYKNDKEVVALKDGQVLYTGLSAGGSIVMDIMHKNIDPKASYVPMSPAGSTGLPYAGKGFKVWGFGSVVDGATPGGLALVKEAVGKFGGKVTTMPNGHGPWNKYYDPSYKEDGKNIYEFSFDGVQAQPQVPIPPVTPEPALSYTVVMMQADGKPLTVTFKLINGAYVWQP